MSSTTITTHTIPYGPTLIVKDTLAFNSAEGIPARSITVTVLPPDGWKLSGPEHSLSGGTYKAYYRKQEGSHA